jgi:CRISPR-associated endonuclease/helicase Cas3
MSGTVKYLAHSKRGDVPEQTYAAHVEGVLSLAERFAGEAAHYGIADGKLFTDSVSAAAVYHDLGKLDAENQRVLSGEKSAVPLPINHTDAGTAFLLRGGVSPLPAAIAVMSHHIGLPDFIAESVRENDAFRDKKVKERVDAELETLLNAHGELVKATPRTEGGDMPRGDFSVFMRLLLSCLADADHTDTAKHYGGYPTSENTIALRPLERLRALDEYVSGLPNGDGERDKLRAEMYAACKAAQHGESVVSCDGPVGSGKTTAVMANLLSQAAKRGLRRIFVVLPFTNIIEQSADVYRKALTLYGENPVEVVVELHHRAEFESADARHLTALWRAPIIVTTAVAFFETLGEWTSSGVKRFSRDF